MSHILKEWDSKLTDIEKPKLKLKIKPLMKKDNLISDSGSIVKLLESSNTNKIKINNDKLKKSNISSDMPSDVSSNISSNDTKKKDTNVYGFNKRNISTLWTEKYRPKTLLDVFGNENQIFQINKWIERYKNHDGDIKRALLLYGPPGTSKTTCANVLLSSNGFKVLYFNASDIRSKNLVEQNILDIINNSKSCEYGIIMDEVDGMSGGDNGGMSLLTKIISRNENSTNITSTKSSNVRGKKSLKSNNISKWIPPIICISNYINDQKFDNLKKECLEIKFDNATNNNLYSVVNNIILKEGLNVTDEAKERIILFSQGDYRRCINLLQTYSQYSNVIDMNAINTYDSIISERSSHMEHFEFTKKLFVSDNNTIFDLYSSYKNYLPMLVHENYPNFIKEFKNVSNVDSLITCYNTINSICTGDTIEKTMYNFQGWILQPLHCISSCCIPKYYSTMYPTKKSKSLIKIDKTKALSKFSLYKSNIKNIYAINNTILTNNNYIINDIHTLSSYILYNVLEGDVNYGFKLLNYYNLSVNSLEKLIKMNKLSDRFKNYKQSTKKKLNDLYVSIYGEFVEKQIVELVYNEKKNNKISLDDE